MVCFDVKSNNHKNLERIIYSNFTQLNDDTNQDRQLQNKGNTSEHKVYKAKRETSVQPDNSHAV